MIMIFRIVIPHTLSVSNPGMTGPFTASFVMDNLLDCDEITVTIQLLEHNLSRRECLANCSIFRFWNEIVGILRRKIGECNKLKFSHERLSWKGWKDRYSHSGRTMLY